MARKPTEDEPEGHEMPGSYIDDNLQPSEDKTKVREIEDDDGNLLDDDDLTSTEEVDMTGAGSGDPSVDHPEPVKAGTKKYEHPSVVEEKTPDQISDHPEPGIEDDEFSDDDDGETTAPVDEDEPVVEAPSSKKKKK